MEKKKFVRIAVTEKTSQYIHYVARALNKPISTLMNELFSEVIATCLQFEDGCNVSYLREYNDVRLRFDGCPRIKVGVIKNVPVDISPEAEDKLIFEESLKLLKNGESENKETFDGEK